MQNCWVRAHWAPASWDPDQLCSVEAFGTHPDVSAAIRIPQARLWKRWVKETMSACLHPRRCVASAASFFSPPLCSSRRLSQPRCTNIPRCKDVEGAVCAEHWACCGPQGSSLTKRSLKGSYRMYKGRAMGIAPSPTGWFPQNSIS